MPSTLRGRAAVVVHRASAAAYEDLRTAGTARGGRRRGRQRSIVAAVADMERSRLRPGDVLLAAGLALFALFGTEPAGRDQPLTAPVTAATYLLTTLAAAALIFWRRNPMGAFVVTGALVATYVVLGFPLGPIIITGAVAAGLMAAAKTLRTVVIAGAVDIVVLGLAIVLRAVLATAGPVDVPTQLLGVVLLSALPLAVGVTVRTRRDAAVRVREEQALRAVSEERLRMAQEVHDVVGHGLAVIAMQAGAGLHVLDRDPEKARAAFEAIRATSKESLDGLRVELATLRGGGPRRPGAALADLGTLVDRVRAGGHDVRLDLMPPGTDVPIATEAAAYRIVQESLTNVLRHAGPGACAVVRVRRVRGRLLVEVADTGGGPPAGGIVPGAGIPGMGDRAERAGGSLEVTGTSGGGVRVRAWLPLTEAGEER
jgi:signal transduction histidine kinase